MRITNAFVLMLVILTSASAATTELPELLPVIPKGEDFTRGGTPIRFWGVNVNAFHDHKMIGPVTERLQAFGFNAIRLWCGPDYGTYTMGDNSEIDGVDRLRAELRRRAIGIYMTPLVSLHGINQSYVEEVEKKDVVEAGEEDRQAWLKAVRSLHFTQWNKTFSIVGAVYLDERMQAIHFREVGRFLDHVNLYTGTRNADENNYVCWDLNNEDGFLWSLVSPVRCFQGGDGIEKWPPYFQAKLQARFNTWLKARYADTGALQKAWGGLDQGEALEQQNIRADWRDAQRTSYGRVRIQDLTQFAVELMDAYYDRYETFIRSKASDPKRGVAVTAMNRNTEMVPHLADFARIDKGSLVSAGCYQTGAVHSPGGSGWREHPRYPLDPTVYRAYHAKDMHYLRPVGKPVVAYEINLIGGFTPYRAEYPWTIAAAASWQNYSGIFFYGFFSTKTPEELIQRSGRNGFHLEKEEVMIAAISAAGQAFINYQIPTAPKPTVVSFKRRLAFDPAMRRYSFEPERLGFAAGATPSLTGLSPEQAQNLFELMRITAFTRGVRITIDDSATSDISVTGPLDPVPADAVRVPWVDWGEKDQLLFGTRLDLKNGLKWNWKDGLLEIDRPNLKAVVGFLEKASYTWSDGITVSGLEEPFVAISLSSMDGEPLVRSKRMRLSALSHAYNEGMRTMIKQVSMVAGVADPFWQRSVKVTETKEDGLTIENGSGPLVIRRVKLELSLPELAGRTATLRDWSLNTIAQRDAATGLTLTDKDEVFDVILEAKP